MNRIDKLFEKFRSRDDKPFLTYLPCVDPSLKETLDLADFYVRNGVDFIEVGVPSILPWLDGRTIQSLHRRACLAGVTTDHVFKVSSLLRKKYPDLPLIPMTTYSTVYSYGVENFCERCEEVDVDAVIIPNYPYVFGGDPHNFVKYLDEHGIYFINFIDGLTLGPKGSEQYELLVKMIRLSKGFIYMPTRAGITGGHGALPYEQIRRRIEKVRKIQEAVGVRTPILLGFGISKPDQVREIVKAGADAICVSSAILRRLELGRDEAGKLIRVLKEATKIK
ncbi:tryptophan synthase subunit alpha [Candidatus Bathyarchaeota archaeon]|nr:MAG: tryptophan synthase subunit alpha [Candidatus Bathyarchaeota archaeon]